MTNDKEAAEVLTTEQIGNKQAFTPEGFLLCSDVPLARVGWMMYAEGESPIAPGNNGYSMVFRDAETLFHKDTLASFAGKPVTDEHPSGRVEPSNWASVSKGIVLNPRRGTGVDSDVMLADILVTDADTILAIRRGKREVSAGYEADYEQGPGLGEGRQLNIIGNHVALVERGRCGPRCAIGDQHHSQLPKGKTMPTINRGTKPTTRVQLLANVRKIFKDAELSAMSAMGGDDPADELLGGTDPTDGNPAEGDNHTHIHLHTGSPPAAQGGQTMDDPNAMNSNPNAPADDIGTRVAALESGMAAIMQKLDTLIGGGDANPAPAEGAQPAEAEPTDDDMDPAMDPNKAAMAMDSAAYEKSYQTMLADAEVLVPGFRVPTFDSKAKRKVTMDVMCGARRRALDIVYATADGKTLIDSVAGAGKDINLPALACDRIASLFKSAAGAKRLLNNRAATGDSRTIPENKGTFGGVPSLADINRINKEFHAARTAANAAK